MTAEGPRRIVLVTGLSGAGKSSILRALEDLGYEAVDNPPLPLIEDLVARGERWLAIGVDVRSRGFRADAILQVLDRLRRNTALHTELVYAVADRRALLRRYSETRRRHPLAPAGRVADGIAAEEALTLGLPEAADLLVDTSESPPAELRRLIERRFGTGSPAERAGGMMVSLISFAYSGGLPPDADLVFDARFLRNPHYDTRLRPRTGLDPEVGAHIEADADYATFYTAIAGLLALVLPRFVQEGKKYATVAIGCTGGRHRSVYLVERLSGQLLQAGWRVTRTHRELAREGVLRSEPPAVGTPRDAAPSTLQAQEA
jgi:RNase adapter protein RapZ